MSYKPSRSTYFSVAGLMRLSGGSNAATSPPSQSLMYWLALLAIVTPLSWRVHVLRAFKINPILCCWFDASFGRLQRHSSSDSSSELGAFTSHTQPTRLYEPLSFRRRDKNRVVWFLVGSVTVHPQLITSVKAVSATLCEITHQPCGILIYSHRGPLSQS